MECLRQKRRKCYASSLSHHRWIYAERILLLFWEHMFSKAQMSVIRYFFLPHHLLLPTLIMSKTAISYALTGRHALLQTFPIIANTLISPMKNRLGLAHSDGYCELSCKRVNAKIEAAVSPRGACCRVSRLQKRIEMSLLLGSGSRTGHLTGPRTLPLLTRNRKCS